MKKKNSEINSYFRISKEADITQTGFLSYAERLSRSHPYIYYVARKIAFYLNIFEREFDGIKDINFSKKKINFLDVGSSDGIAIKYINKIKPLNFIYAFEPNKLYFKKLIKLKNNFNNLKCFNFGLSNKAKEHVVFIPYFRFLGSIYYMITYTFYDLIELRENLKINFIFKKNIKIKKLKIKLNKFNTFKNRIDLVKLDVNGHEFNILKGLKKLILRDKPAFILEELENIRKIQIFMNRYHYKCYYYDVNVKKLIQIKAKNNKNLNFYFLQKKHLKLI